ncbi:hypothetical protein EA187_05675 [Lujinxingia sediminis]|uniref:Uncharacterized protein n=1 Tax=Lujinxingia sediminis TaxID=2480984 RepID=A0ABY0CYE3_9DELT|nr:hypothetical protein [Lujinxingia sediminis]RVU48916.1 hypothetical protein EA187_05675 [Lujinxingia sediminis]
MDTRTILQIVLGVVIALILVVGGLMVVALTGDAETVIVEQAVAEQREVRERKNPWADQGEAAIALVQRSRVKGVEPGEDGEEVADTVGKLVASDSFVKEKLKITGAEPAGWQAQWWGETKFGPSFFLVRYAFQDANIRIGPAWLVDLKTQKVVPKNVLAQVASDPEKGEGSKYYDKAAQVVSAMTNHRFPAGINLGGALLLYFDQRESSGEGDTVLGWTIDHDRDNLFRAYFQWTEGGEQTYAEFEFDFDKRALRAVNLQAAQIMRVGEEFEPTDRVSIMPGTYDPKQRVASNRWLGPARTQCGQPRHRDGCKALATLLDQSDLIETLEWMLTAQADTAEAFETCKEERKCRWMPEVRGEGVYRIKYVYNLDGNEQTIAWDVNLRKDEVDAADRVSQLSQRAVNPRG